MTSALISCLLDLDVCIFFSGKKKSELKAKRVWTWVMDGLLKFCPVSLHLQSSTFASSMFRLWALTGKELNDCWLFMFKTCCYGCCYSAIHLTPRRANSSFCVHPSQKTWMGISRDRKELPEICWCQNNQILKAFQIEKIEFLDFCIFFISGPISGMKGASGDPMADTL